MKATMIRPKIMFGTSLIIFVLFGLLWKRWNIYNHFVRLKKSFDKPPVKWKKIGEVSGLMLYPLKSGRGIPLTRAECGALGLVDSENPHLKLSDREFIVYEPDKRKAVTGLVNSRMVLVVTSPVDEATLKFSFPGNEDFYLKLPILTRGVVVLDRWWGEKVMTVDCGDDVACWFSQSLLNKPTGLRLGYFSRPTVPRRSVQNGWAEFAKVYQTLRSEYLGAYSYMASYLVVSQESLDELNSRLCRPSSVEQFRANIVVKGSSAYNEDTWDWFRLGETVIMRGFKPCTRCAVISINPNTGKLDPKLEPLSTLKQYRQVKRPEERKLAGSEPVFGLYAGLHTAGTVRLGDTVYVDGSPRWHT